MRAERIRERLPIYITAAVALGLYLAAGFMFEGFFTFRVLGNLFSDNAFLGIAAVGLTFVILTGGIDLSVGSMVGCSSIMAAALIERGGLPPFAALAVALGFGAMVGAAHGLLISRFELPPFLVTLAGLFLCRGIALWISRESVQVDEPTFNTLAAFSVALPGKGGLTVGALVFLLTVAFGIFAARQTRFGRTVYAIGGDAASSVLMGLPVRRTIVGTYMASGAAAALGGLVFTLYTSSGNAVSGTGLELDAIAAVVIGGTLLSGGYGSVFGTLLGVLILGIIQTSITFEGSLSSWWSRIAVGLLLLIFIVVQKFIERTAARGR